MPVWTVAIETVATAGSVALLCGDELHTEHVLPPALRSAKTLAAAVRSIWTEAGRPPVSLVAVAKGPGSFTGLRVGVITAKALAYAWGAQLIGVNSLDSVAAQAPTATRPGDLLDVILEAQRQELFVASFQALESRQWERKMTDIVTPVEKWLPNVPQLVSGPPLKKLREKIPDPVQIAPEATWNPTAATVGRLAIQQQRAGAADELWTLVPHYIRPTYADEKRGQTHG